MPLSDLRRVLLVMLLLCASGWAGAAQPAPPASAASADKAAAAKLTKEIAKTKKLSAALAAANDGLTSYLTKTGEDA